MQLTCRDRNRIALQSELLSASAMGIPNVLLMTGDHPRFGDHADAKPVFDLDSLELLRVAAAMRDEGKLMSGRELDPAPSWLIGAVENPSGPAESGIARLGQKIVAGAQFVQTQFVFDVHAFAGWMSRVRDLGLQERCRILAGVGPVLSLRALDHLQGNVPGMHVPGQVADRLRGAGPAHVREEGKRLCAETISQLREIPGVAGVHVMAVANESAIPEILELAGMTARHSGTAPDMTAGHFGAAPDGTAGHSGTAPGMTAGLSGAAPGGTAGHSGAAPDGTAGHSGTTPGLPGAGAEGAPDAD